MDRRLALTALASVIACPALAQQTPAQNAAAPMPMGEAEMTHARRTMTLGAMSLATSRIAHGKATDDDVKEFSGFEIAEQDTIADILKGMMEPKSAAAVGQVKAPSDAEVAEHLDAKGKAMVEKLREAKAGAAFDREYVTGQIEGHRQLLDAQEDYLKVGKDRDHLNIAKLARGQIKEHIALLTDIEKDLRKG